MKAILPALLFLATTSLLNAQTAPEAASVPKPKLTPAQVHSQAIVIDTHADTPQRFVDENYDLAEPLNGGNLNLDSANKATSARSSSPSGSSPISTRATTRGARSN